MRLIFRLVTDPWGVLFLMLALWLALFGVMYVMSMVASMPSSYVEQQCAKIKNRSAVDDELCPK